jgi:anti-anti-sigma factor
MANNNLIVDGFDDEKNDDLQITLETIPTIESGCLITLKGMIDTYNSSFFQSQITKVITAGYINIVFKCTYLEYIASTGLGNFTNLLKLIKAVNGDFVIADVQPKIEEYFSLLGFSQFFTLRPTITEAIDYFLQKTNPLSSVFPRVGSCPFCKKSLKFEKPAKVRCPACSSIIIIKDDGTAVLS